MAYGCRASTELRLAWWNAAPGAERDKALEALTAHLETCEECRRQWEELKGVVNGKNTN